MHLYNDHFQNSKRYNIPKAQLIIADIPYNTGTDAYASNPQWYVGGEIAAGQSAVAGKQFFDTDNDFRISEFMHFVSRMLKKEPKETGQAGCMIVFCAFEKQIVPSVKTQLQMWVPELATEIGMFDLEPVGVVPVSEGTEK